MSLRRLLPAFVVLALVVVTTSVSFAQSTAVNGTIEGTVLDSQESPIPGAAVIATNLDTGLVVDVRSDPYGFYRFLLLPLGRYSVKVELTGFKAIERTGVVLVAGRTAVLNVRLEVGGVAEVVSVSGDVPIADPGKIDLGRTISADEVKNLPLVSRNPYNFAFLQANVTGYENQEFGVARVNANGSQMRTSYQIDGNTNTQKDRAGLRLLPSSEIMVQEVKVITSGFAPEFGQTTGMVFNAITPSGTNAFHGSLAYRDRRAGMTERPFFLRPDRRKPDNNLKDYTATLGGPIVRDRVHFYGGYEYVDQDLRDFSRVIASQTQANAAALGLSPGAIPPDGVIPTKQQVHFALGKLDAQLAPGHHLSGRYYFFKNTSPYNIAGNLNTVERATDFNDRMDSASLQLVSSYGATALNELRVQYARRHQFRTPSAGGGTGPAVLVSGIAAFGGPFDASQSANFDFNQRIFQVIDNFSWISGPHNFKLGFDVQMIDDERRNTLRTIYTFPTVAAYLAARDGVNPRSYTTFVQDIGDPFVGYDSRFIGLFVQDDLRLSPSFKVLFGLRYDLFQIPDARPFAANPLSQKFTVDKSNFGPRAGFAWTLDGEGKTVLRGSTGIMYEPPLLNFYEDAIQRNGDPRLLSVSLGPSAIGSPAFPNDLSSLPPGFPRPRQSIVAVHPNFKTQWSVLTNVQLEHGLGQDLAVAVGYVNSLGLNLPFLLDTNLITQGPVLDDGRAVYAIPVTPATRVDPAFDHVDTFRSIGRAQYHAGTVGLTKRMSDGVQFQAVYTLAKGTDNAPLTGTYVVGSTDDRLSDPTNVERDRGVTPFNQTHTFVFSGVVAPQVPGEGLLERLLDNNQLAFIFQANSGLPFNIISNRDLNQDGVLNDRPLGVGRNTGRLGRVLNLDARYSRLFPFSDTVRLELFIEGKNILNRRNVSAVNRVVPVDAAGNPVDAAGDVIPLPTTFSPSQGYQQRQLQLGAKFRF